MAKPNVDAVATANESVVNAVVKSYRLQSGNFGRTITIDFDQELPTFNDDGSDATTGSIKFTLKQLIGQLLNVRPEASDLLEKVNLASKANNPTLMQAFLKVILTDATYEIESIAYDEGDVFEDGTVALHKGYRRNLTSVTFAPAVEAKIKPITLDDALAALGL